MGYKGRDVSTGWVHEMALAHLEKTRILNLISTDEYGC